MASPRIEELKAELVRHRAVETPTAEQIEAFRQHLYTTLEALRPRLEARGKWQAIVDDLTSTPLDELYYAAEGNRGRALTVLGREFLDDVEGHARYVIAAGVPGDFCEAGVFRGGISILLSALLGELAPRRRLWAADSFRGLPPPDPDRDAPAEIASWAVLSWTGAFATNVDEVVASFERLGAYGDHVKLLVGWFEDTLPTAPIEALALLRVDCQYEHSTRTVLEALYPKLSAGGRVLLNDYGHGAYWGARAAIDAFRAKHSITADVHMQGHSAWWQKPT
ncbi:MAG: TylF/MycF/NovP-related O-methyltransferase [Myxococcota bacterium]